MTKEFELSFDIYDKSFVKQAIVDFADVSKIELHWTDLIIIWDDLEEIDEIFNEFMNYVIWLSN